MAGDTKFLLWLLLLSSSSLCFGSDLDIQCLKSVQQSVTDPNGVLKWSWNFDNSSSTGFICKFTGVECWHPDEDRVLSLRLGHLGLEGSFPQGLQNCTSMTGLDLSRNNFSGPIPPGISRQMPYLTSLDLSYNSFSGSIPQNISNINYLTSLDLSYNSFSGSIPQNISNMIYLNLLNLEHNQLSGSIPAQFYLLSWLTTFSVADNLLSGPVPPFPQMFQASSFAGNEGLCGSPLEECSASRRINDESYIGAAVGFIVGFVVALYFSPWFICSERLRAYVLHI